MTDSDTYVCTPKASNIVNVTVKDSTITVGEEWNPADNFVSATDNSSISLEFHNTGKNSTRYGGFSSLT
jgi:hypothetical protein